MERDYSKIDPLQSPLIDMTQLKNLICFENSIFLSFLIFVSVIDESKERFLKYWREKTMIIMTSIVSWKT